VSLLGFGRFGGRRKIWGGFLGVASRKFSFGLPSSLAFSWCDRESISRQKGFDWPAKTGSIKAGNFSFQYLLNLPDGLPC